MSFILSQKNCTVNHEITRLGRFRRFHWWFPARYWGHRKNKQSHPKSRRLGQSRGLSWDEWGDDQIIEQRVDTRNKRSRVHRGRSRRHWENKRVHWGWAKSRRNPTIWDFWRSLGTIRWNIPWYRSRVRRVEKRLQDVYENVAVIRRCPDPRNRKSGAKDHVRPHDWPTYRVG